MFRTLGNPASISLRRSSMYNIVPSTVKSAIKPSDIYVNRIAPEFSEMMGMLDRGEYGNAAALFVYNSQDHGQWMGFIYEGLSASGSNFAKMVELGLLTEKHMENGWLYELTPFVIEQIYLRQSKQVILSLKIAVMHAHGITFWARLRKLFTSAPTFA